MIVQHSLPSGQVVLMLSLIRTSYSAYLDNPGTAKLSFLSTKHDLTGCLTEV